MAVAIGTAHGFYKSEPKLDFERLLEIHEKVVPYLVLHGGTGVSNEDLQKCISCGISKINVGTQLKKVFSDTIRERCNNLSEDVVDPRKYIENVKINIEAAVLDKLNVFRSENKA